MESKIKKIGMFMAMLWISISASAYDFEVDGIGYDITSFTELTVTASAITETNKEEIVIPSIVDFNGKSLKVTKVGDSFAPNSEITKAFISDNVTEIGQKAFYGCKKLISVTFGKRVKSVGDRAFDGCEQLQEITSDSLVDIGACAFEGCGSLSRVELNNVSSVQDGAFKNCSVLADCEINMVSFIGKNSFDNCRSLEAIHLPESLISIGDEAFNNCVKLSECIIPNSVKTIGKNVFSNCESLHYVSIGNGISYLPKCFAKCGKLSFVRFEDGENPITMDCGSELYATYNGVHTEYIYKGYFSDTNVSKIYLGRNFLNYYDSPTNWQDIFSNPFLGASKLQEIEIGATVNKLPAIQDNWLNKYGTFENCTGLKMVKLGQNIESISINCFKNCSSLENLSIPNKVSDIPSGTFINCVNLSEISFGYNCNVISASAFTGCEALNRLYFYCVEPPTCEATFSNSTYIASTLFIPIGAKNKFEKSSPWSNFWNIIEDPHLLAYFTKDNVRYEVLLDNKVDVIGVELEDLSDITINKNIIYEGQNYMLSGIRDDAFKNNCYINSITFPDDMLALQDSLFYGCANLKEVCLPKNLKELGSNTFAQCSKLEQIRIPNTLYSIGSSCFSGCSSLKTIDLSENKMTELADNLFYNCTVLSEIRMPVELKTIAARCFYNCENLSSIDLNNILLIGEEAFRGCKSISELIIPSSCTQISSGAFSGMETLHSVKFESGNILTMGHNGNLTFSSSITPFPNPSDVDERRTGFRNGYYDGLFYGLPIEHLVINRDIELPKYYERTMGTPTSRYSTVYNDIVYYPPFYGLTNLKSLEIGENVSAICINQIEAVVNAVPTTMEYTNFGKCDNIEVVISNNPNAPIGGGFSQATYESASLFLPNGGADSYKSDDYWKNFAHIVESTFVPIESISFESDEVTMDINDSKLLHPIINPSEASIKTLKWSSSKPSIVNVSEDGVITTSLREGEAIITASACDGTNLSASIKIIVQEGAGISDVLSDGRIDISVENGRLYIHGKHDTDTVSIYNVQGQLIISTYDNEIELSTKGIYIIKVGSICEKIIL